MINNALNQFVKSIADIISKPGHINVDFADIKTIMKQKGFAIIGNGRAAGESRARDAALQAISSPLLDNMQIAGARGVLLNISGGSSLGLHEVNEAASIIYEQAHEDASIILGSVVDESLGDDVMVTVIATDFATPQVEAALEIKSPVERQAPSVTMQVNTVNTMVSREPVVEPVALNLTNLANPEGQKLSIDLNDLDIPAVMRRMAQKEQNN